MSEELDRREMLEAALEQAEEGTLEAPIEKEIEVNDDPIEVENEEKRDEKGRFTSKETTDNTAEEPELVVIRNLTPKYSAKRFSNASLKRPVVSHPSNEASTIFFNSAASNTLPDGGTTVVPGVNVLGVY